jgi:TonB family protein
MVVALMLSGGWAANIAPQAWGQAENKRKAKRTVNPMYPELARRMKISGVVKVMVTIAPDGTVKETHLLGGHPLLANAVMDAVKRWRFEAGSETTENLEFHFAPSDY